MKNNGKRFLPDYYYYDNYSINKKIECIIEELDEHCADFCIEYVNKDIQETCPYCGLCYTKKKLKELKEEINEKI